MFYWSMGMINVVLDNLHVSEKAMYELADETEKSDRSVLYFISVPFLEVLDPDGNTMYKNKTKKNCTNFLDP